MDEIPELDLCGLEADLYKIIQLIDKQNYGKARSLAWALWVNVHQFRISPDDSHLPATTDRDLRALLIKVWYALRNMLPLPCDRLGFYCHWMYPYGFVPEGGCPYHD